MTKSKTMIAMNISQRIFAVSDSLAKAVDEIIGQCEPRLTQYRILDPNVLTFLLLCRTRSNFIAAILLIKQRMIVEARTLARCCFENAFLVAGLHEQGRAFVDRIA
jgi:hypothetical protein